MYLQYTNTSTIYLYIAKTNLCKFTTIIVGRKITHYNICKKLQIFYSVLSEIVALGPGKPLGGPGPRIRKELNRHGRDHRGREKKIQIYFQRNQVKKQMSP